MKKRIAWLISIYLLVLALVLSSCVKEETPPTTSTETPTTTSTETPTTTSTETPTTTSTTEKSRYGGMLSISMNAGPLGFDETLGSVPYKLHSLFYTNETLNMGDWGAGPSGTGEVTWYTSQTVAQIGKTGCLATSWELEDPETVVFHIRKGVYFHNKLPTNGREMNANDVVFSLKRVFETPTAYMYKQYTDETRPLSITARDKWTVVVKCPSKSIFPIIEHMLEQVSIVPPEVVTEYGSLQDWEVSCGTGPFMLTDYVPDSVLTFERNPNYWGKHPLYPQDTLPYLDGLKLLIIQDSSTSQASLRTGQIDQLWGINYKDAQALMATTSNQLKKQDVLLYNPNMIFMRIDTKPFDDIRVRQALCMAVDRNAIVESYYEGMAEILAFPAQPVPEDKAYYTPVEELPPTARELFEYNPDKAKSLLALAGYSEGFETNIICSSEHVDMLSIFKYYWEEIGVDVTLDVKEYSIWYSSATGRKHDQMIIRGLGAGGNAHKWLFCRPGLSQNMSFVDDQIINDKYEELKAHYLDTAWRSQTMKELIPYILEQAWFIQIPADYQCTMWWPWIGGYNGEWSVGYSKGPNWPIWVWLDQELKKSMDH